MRLTYRCGYNLTSDSSALATLHEGCALSCFEAGCATILSAVPTLLHHRYSLTCISCCSFDGIVKVDLLAPAGKGWAAHIHLPGYTLGEPFFVPRDPEGLRAGIIKDPYHVAQKEDEGWVLVWAVEKATAKSQCLVRLIRTVLVLVVFRNCPEKQWVFSRTVCTWCRR